MLKNREYTKKTAYEVRSKRIGSLASQFNAILKLIRTEI